MKRNYEAPEISVISLISDEAIMDDGIPGGNTGWETDSTWKDE